MELTLARQAEGFLAAAAGEADHARAAIDDALESVPEEEVPDNVGETFRTAADIERMLGNTAREREHLTKAEARFRAKGNVVRAREMGGRLPDLGADR